MNEKERNIIFKEINAEYWDRYIWIGSNPNNKEIWKKQLEEYKELANWYCKQLERVEYE